MPTDLAQAYAVQEAAIALWPEPVRGWKVAAIHPDLRQRFRAARMAGPAFAGGVVPVTPGTVGEVAVIDGGFIAVETEIGIVMGADLPPRTRPWTRDELVPFVGEVRVAMEIAGSPLPGINEFGPPAIVSDFGNNTAIALGAPLAIAQGLSDIETAMLIDGEVAGRGRSHGPNGGPLDALLFLVNHLADRGRGLAKGEVVSAGATTGVHPIAIGQGAEAVCAGAPPLSVRLVAREPAR
ncbi:MAG: 2-keto-4-pentenoate hydratase [Bosea sp. (in: a-proteobacteria)]|uniref:2-keto-4-pentenoate hydratase n=1 Tax=Bosea sp. (in: a-proteobacteria) TaxID=1871050 RepID=UPI003F7C6932